MITRADSLKEGDLIDLVPLLEKFPGGAWEWAPFGTDESQRAEALKTVAMNAECELAEVEELSPVKDGKVCIYNNMMNIVVPANHLVDVIDNAND